MVVRTHNGKNGLTRIYKEKRVYVVLCGGTHLFARVRRNAKSQKQSRSARRMNMKSVAKHATIYEEICKIKKTVKERRRST